MPSHVYYFGVSRLFPALFVYQKRLSLDGTLVEQNDEKRIFASYSSSFFFDSVSVCHGQLARTSSAPLLQPREQNSLGFETLSWLGTHRLEVHHQLQHLSPHSAYRDGRLHRTL